jgi:hypothetical protein
MQPNCQMSARHYRVDAVERASVRCEYYGRSRYAARWADWRAMVLPAQKASLLSNTQAYDNSPTGPSEDLFFGSRCALPSRSLAIVITSFRPVVRLKQGWDAVP